MRCAGKYIKGVRHIAESAINASRAGKPILFSSGMVRAILDKRKFQTRRIVNPQPRWSETHGWLRPCGPGKYDSNKRLEQHFEKSADGSEKILRQREYELPVEEWLMTFCRFKVGMRLWVRESFQIHDADGSHRGISYNADPENAPLCWMDCGEEWTSAIPDMGISEFGKFPPTKKGKPSIHMPRWASRLTLEVTRVKVERLNDISSSDAKAEGVDTTDTLDVARTAPRNKWVCRYRQLWDEINGAGSWEVNPWVWKIEFRKVEKS